MSSRTGMSVELMIRARTLTNNAHFPSTTTREPKLMHMCAQTLTLGA